MTMGIMDIILNAKYASDYETGRVIAKRYPRKNLEELESYFTGNEASKERKRAGAAEEIKNRGST